MKTIKSGFLKSKLGEYWFDFLESDKSNTFILVITELIRNKGKSVTNCIEDLAKLFIKKENLSLDNSTILFVERYENHPEYFEWVFLNEKFIDPKWNQATEKEFNLINPYLTNVKDIPINEPIIKEYDGGLGAGKLVYERQASNYY